MAPELGKLLIGIGVLLLVAGLFLWLGPSLPGLGRLPGDLRIERPGFTLYLPIGTCVLISLVLSLVLWIVSRLR